MGCKTHPHALFSPPSGPLSLLVLVCFTAAYLVLPCLCKPFPLTNSRPGFIIPLGSRHGNVRARGLLKNGSLPVLGTVRVGYFYTQLWVGTPPRSFSVIIDTGSTITYIPCTGCSHCGRHQHTAFDTSSSATYQSIGCTSPKCECGSPPCACRGQKCYYYRTYAEQSTSEGWLVQDTYYFPDKNTTVPVVFGCENRETGEIYNQMADGILGMGNNDIAFHSQLHAAGVIDDVFGLCFAWPSGGAMLLGNSTPPDLNLMYTPIVSHPLHKHYFNIKMTGIKIGNKTLDLDYRRHFDSGRGTVMDSGTTFTYLPNAAYERFLGELESAAAENGLEKEWVGNSQFRDICWKTSIRNMEELEAVLPVAEFVFEGNTTLRLPPYRYLFMWESGRYCLGLFDNGNNGALIGGISVRNVLVQYDRGQQRYGFAEADCSSIGLAAAIALDPLLLGANISIAAPKLPPPTAPPHPPSAPSPPPSPQPPPRRLPRKSNALTSWPAAVMLALSGVSILGMLAAAAWFLCRKPVKVAYSPIQTQETETEQLVKPAQALLADSLEMCTMEGR